MYINILYLVLTSDFWICSNNSLTVFSISNKASSCFPEKKSSLPKNFCFFLYRRNQTARTYRKKDVHLLGFSFIPIEVMLLLILLIIFWWVLRFVVRRQKSSAQGRMTGCESPTLKPILSSSSFRISCISLCRYDASFPMNCFDFPSIFVAYN